MTDSGKTVSAGTPTPGVIGSGTPPSATGEGILRRPGGERAFTWVALGHFFFIISAYYVCKPIRESLAIELGAARIPALNILSMVSLIGANAVYSWVVGRFTRERFAPAILQFFFVTLLGFWVMFRGTHGEAWQGGVPTWRVWAIAAYFLWVNIFGLFTVSMFWSLMNDLCTTEQGGRLYPRIGYGGLAGGLAGGLLTARLAEDLGTANLFLVAAGLLLCSLGCLHVILRLAGAHPEVGEGARAAAPAPRPWDGLTCTLASPVLLLLALEMFLYTFGSSIFSYQINALLEKTLTARDLRTVFMANLYNLINGISLVTQLVVTSLVMKLPNPMWGLALLPLGQIAGSLWLIGSPILPVAAATSVFRYSLNYSMGRVVRELMYTLVSREEKYQGKGFVDTLVFRAGDGMASVLVLGGLQLWDTGPWVDGSVIATNLLALLTMAFLAGQFARRTRAGAQDAFGPVAN